MDKKEDDPLKAGLLSSLFALIMIMGIVGFTYYLNTVIYSSMFTELYSKNTYVDSTVVVDVVDKQVSSSKSGSTCIITINDNGLIFKLDVMNLTDVVGSYRQDYYASFYSGQKLKLDCRTFRDKSTNKVVSKEYKLPTMLSFKSEKYK